MRWKRRSHAVGAVQLTGKVFGVFKVTPPGGATLDVSLPRRESKIGAHHRDFHVEPDPAMTPQEAARRRDFTTNSAAWDPQTAEILDFYGAMADIDAGILRMVDERAFVEDPLRVLRGVRFAARFGWRIEERTALLCRQIAGEYPTLSIERVWIEWEQWARGNQPSAGLRALVATDWVRHYPELAALIDLPQDPAWHPEGDVWTHTGYVCDAMAATCMAEGVTAPRAAGADVRRPLPRSRQGDHDRRERGGAICQPRPCGSGRGTRDAVPHPHRRAVRLCTSRCRRWWRSIWR